jgi:hypothetical protein
MQFSVAWLFHVLKLSCFFLPFSIVNLVVLVPFSVLFCDITECFIVLHKMGKVDAEALIILNSQGYSWIYVFIASCVCKFSTR